MKAIVFHKYGSRDVLALEEVPKPVPGEHEMLVQVHASSVNAADWHLFRGDPYFARFMFGFPNPNITVPGADVAGIVIEAGSGVTRFKPGDEIIADKGGSGFGGFAEFAVVPESAAVSKPATLPFEEAGCIPLAGHTAFQALRSAGQLAEGNDVLIYGASGGVGSFAVQIAHAFGANVTAVCSGKNTGLVASLGASTVVDYQREDFTASGKKFDLILAANGNRKLCDFRNALKPGGRYVQTGGSMSQFYKVVAFGPFLSTGGRKLAPFLQKQNADELADLVALVANGKVRPVLDRFYNLEEVPEAIRYMEDEHPQGKIGIKISSY